MQQDLAFARDSGDEQSPQSWPSLEEKGAILKQGIWFRFLFGLTGKVLMLDTLKVSPSPLMLT